MSNEKWKIFRLPVTNSTRQTGMRFSLAADCLLLLPPVFSEFVFVLVIVQVVFFHDVQLYRIESDYFKFGTAFFTGNAFAFISVRIHMDISITLGTCSSRHFLTSRRFY